MKKIKASQDEFILARLDSDLKISKTSKDYNLNKLSWNLIATVFFVLSNLLAFTQVILVKVPMLPNLE